jgi:sugar lactone lactonase YvrE
MSVDSQSSVGAAPLGARPPVTVPARRFHPGALRLLMGILILALLVNIAFPLLLSRMDTSVLTVREAQSSGVILATPINAEQLLVATLDNRIQRLVDGVGQTEVTFDNLIGGLAVAPDGNTIYVGTSAGQLHILDSSLAIQRTVPVTGRVVGLAAVADGFLVSYGSGAYSDRYWTSFYPAASDAATYTTRAEFTITAMTATAGHGAVYGTANSRVSRLDDAGNELWKVTLTQPPTDFHYVATTDQILVGDERGNLTLLDPNGAIRWAVNLSAYAMRSVYALADGADGANLQFFAADEHGDLYIVDSATNVLFGGSATASDVAALVQLGDTLTLIPRNANWQNIHPRAGQHAATGVERGEYRPAYGAAGRPRCGGRTVAPRYPTQPTLCLAPTRRLSLYSALNGVDSPL